MGKKIALKLAYGNLIIKVYENYKLPTLSLILLIMNNLAYPHVIYNVNEGNYV